MEKLKCSRKTECESHQSDSDRQPRIRHRLMERGLGDAAADAFIDEMLTGSFLHFKEYFAREEGPVKDRSQTAEDVVNVVVLSRP